MRKAPPYVLGAPYLPKRRRPFSRTLYCYLLFRQFCPLLTVVGAVGACLYYYNLGGAGSAASHIARQAYEISGIARRAAAGAGGGDRTAGDKADPRTAHAGGQVKRYEEMVPVYSFVLFGSYRMSDRAFAVVGLAGRILHDARQLGPCMWKETNGGHRAVGKLQAFYPGEHHDLRYEALVIQCQLDESTEHDAGGELVMNIDKEDIVVYQEKPNTFPRANPVAPFKYDVAYCSPPIYDTYRPRQVYEFIEYGLRQGVSFFVFYDAGGVHHELMQTLQPYVALGLAEVVDTRRVAKYESWQRGQVMLMNDCAYRTRFTANWALFTDLNEYFASSKGLTLAAHLDALGGNRPYVTFGSRWWSIEKCLPPVNKRDWTIERMVFHWPDVYCTNKEEYPRSELCLDYYGFRRYAVNPREVNALQIHRCESPRSGGVDVDADVAVVNRWHELLDMRSKVCAHEVKPDEVVDWWVRDSRMAAAVELVKGAVRARYKGPQ